MIESSNYTKKKFIIYGAATTGAVFYRNLIKQGEKVEYFVDKRFDEIDSYLEIPVVGMDFINNIATKNEYVIIIAIKNVFEHEDIASKFIEVGYYNILFKSNKLVKGNPNEREQTIGMLYDRLFLGERVNILDIPQSKSIHYFPFEDKEVKEIDEEYIQSKIPAAFVFSDKYENQSIIWNSVCMEGLVSHLDFFKCISGHLDAEYDDYFTFCYQAAERSGGIVTSERWKASVLENRIDVYQNMELELQLHPDFFDNNAPLATLSEKGIFNIHSGKHRIVFQIVNGKFFIPLKMSKEEYGKWVNEEVAKQLYDCLCKNRIRKLQVPIMNPYFYEYPCDNMMFYYNLQKEIVNFIYRYYYNKKKSFCFEKDIVYNYGKQGLMINPVLMKMGLQVYTKDTVEKEYNEIVDLLYRLYGVMPKRESELVVNANIIITDDINNIVLPKQCELLFLISKFEEEQVQVKGKEYKTIGSGFCNGKRMKIQVYIMGGV